MRRAESQLAEAANRVAELSMQRLPELAVGGLSGVQHGRPLLGITLSNAAGEESVDGVMIMGISPGGAADEAGLRTGDVITAINDSELAADNARTANEKLLTELYASGAGVPVELAYARDGESTTVTVTPRAFNNRTLSIRDMPSTVSFAMPSRLHASPANRFVFLGGTGGLGDMEMVSLTPKLGEYFGVSEGLLVVRAPEKAEVYQLEDGDVILDIDGRAPQSVPHAVRILASYQGGETLKLRIMREQRPRTLEIAVPETTPGTMALPTGPALRSGGGADRQFERD